MLQGLFSIEQIRVSFTKNYMFFEEHSLSRQLGALFKKMEYNRNTSSIEITLFLNALARRFPERDWVETQSDAHQFLIETLLPQLIDEGTAMCSLRDLGFHAKSMFSIAIDPYYHFVKRDLKMLRSEFRRKYYGEKHDPDSVLCLDLDLDEQYTVHSHDGAVMQYSQRNESLKMCLSSHRRPHRFPLSADPENKESQRRITVEKSNVIVSLPNVLFVRLMRMDFHCTETSPCRLSRERLRFAVLHHGERRRTLTCITRNDKNKCFLFDDAKCVKVRATKFDQYFEVKSSRRVLRPPASRTCSDMSGAPARWRQREPCWASGCSLERGASRCRSMRKRMHISDNRRSGDD